MIHSFTYAAKSDKGLVRQNNQDAFHVSREHGVVIVADGMGGHQAGEIASQVAIEAIKKDFEQVGNWIKHLNDNPTLTISASVSLYSSLISLYFSKQAILAGMYNFLYS